MDGHDSAKQRAANPSLSFLRTLAIKVGDRRAIGQALSAADISQLCLEEDIDIPGAGREDQTVEQGPQQIGKIMKPLFKDRDELTIEGFQVVRTAQQQLSEAGHTFDAYRYTFRQVNPVTPASPEPPVNVSA